ncbi:MAG TPA: hypothetical protein EYP19_09520 [Desulfobacterales bacterium]|nr:hypothetical protein [Desulfobacterales bacterium]
MGASSQLYDKVHAALVNWLIREIRSQADVGGYDDTYQVYPEFAYNYYGHRGSVDVLTYHVGWSQGEKRTQGILELYEVWSAIHRLEEAIRKFNEKAEFTPKYFLASRKPEGGIGLQRNFFVLLNSLQNVTLIRENWHTFNSQFFEFHKILNVLDWVVVNQLVLIDPLNPRHFVYGRFDPEDDETVVASFPWIIVNLPAGEPKLQDRLEEWSYLDTTDFWEKYRSQKTAA